VQCDFAKGVVWIDIEIPAKQKNTQWEDCVYKDSRKRKEEKSAKSKRLRRVLWERLDSSLLERNG
jgi:hypothetical protein